MRMLSALRFDIRFQFRHGFYYAYLIVSLLYIVMLRFMPPEVGKYVSVLLLFSDPAVLGFFFIGGIILLEKSQNTLESLFVTPFRIHEYIAAKVLSLTLIALAASFAIISLSYSTRFSPIPLFLGVMLSSFFFTLLGLVLAVRARSLNSFLLISPFYTIVFFLPALDYLGIYKFSLFSIIPSSASILLIKAAFVAIPVSEVLISIIVLCFWIVLTYLWAYRSFYKHIILKIGGHR